jgi:hypothetical protein
MTPASRRTGFHPHKHGGGAWRRFPPMVAAMVVGGWSWIIEFSPSLLSLFLFLNFIFFFLSFD